MVTAEVIRNQKSLMMTRNVGDSLGLHEAMLGELRLIFLSRCITCDETLYKLVKTPSLSVNLPTKFFSTYQVTTLHKNLQHRKSKRKVKI